jgi:cell division protease FtsH
MASRPTPRPARRPTTSAPLGWAALLILFGLAVLFLWVVNTPKVIDYTDLWRFVEEKKVSKVTFVGNDRLEGEFKEEEMAALRQQGITRREFVTDLIPASNESLAKAMREANVKISRREDPSSWIVPLLANLLPMLVLIGVFVFLILPRMRDPMGGGFISNYTKSPARQFDKTKGRVTFDDVADMESAKSELREVIEFLREPSQFTRLGAQVPKGVLLVGPPGTGKTLLARACAGEADVPFFSINGAEFIQLFVGVGASRVRDLFKTAKENSPCIVFIDEIDAVGRMRGAGLGGGSDEREQTLNQILGEMDGFTPNDQIIVLAATNRHDVLDPALLRPGRFDRHIVVDRQNWQGRLAVLKVHTRNKPLADDVDLEAIARQMIGMTGADLRNLANEAALLATRQGKKKLEREDFEQAIDRVMRGPKREEIILPEEKRRTAYHEAGHALVGWLVPSADRPMKVSIIPRGRSLGVTITIPEEDFHDRGLSYFKAKLLVLMGGRAADRLVLGEPYAGAEMDLREATRLARYMVTHWGMSERLGPISLRVGEEHVFLGKEIQSARDFSEGMMLVVDEEVQRMLREADEAAFEILLQNRLLLDELVELLLKREELSKDEIDELVRNHARKRVG